MPNGETLSTEMLIFIGIAGFIQLALMLAAIVVNLKSSEEELTLARPIWIVISVVFSFLGPIAFFIAGRRKTEQVVTKGANSATASSVIDELYGGEL